MIGVAERIARDHLRLVRVKDEFISAACPFHKGGKERRPSFWINRSTGEWGCFSCNENGKDLRELMRELGVSNRKAETEVAQAMEEAKSELELERARRRKKNRASFKGEYVLPESLLGVFDYAPVALIESGFPKTLLRRHDVGFDKRNARITFPIRDLFGNLIGISGRTVLDEVPKYKVYEGTRTIEGKRIPGELSEYTPWYSSRGIRDHLWRAHFFFHDVFNEKSENVIIVEGYKAAMWMALHGYENTAALMGSRMSKAQERIIMRMGTPTWVLLDNNRAGREGSHNICGRLARGPFPVYECTYPEWCDESFQPDDISPEGLEHVLSTARRVGGRVYGYKKKRT